MAEIIPDRLPSRASAGEKRLFTVLQKLPDDYIVYYEPVIENRYPDFIIICPDLGMMVIEVKGWYPGDIRSATNQSVVVREAGQEVNREHPISQARGYMFNLMDKCRKHGGFGSLINHDGLHKGRFTFPFGHFAVLSNITTEQLASHSESSVLGEIFPTRKVVTRDKLQTWLDLSDQELVEKLKSFFDPWWSFPKLSEQQVKALRAVIHPEILITPVFDFGKQSKEAEPLPVLDLKVLDLRQENNARNIGEGHRIIYGVAGSGKTVLLISRARLICNHNAQARVLVLCYNLTLSLTLKKSLSDQLNAEVFHFDGWASANGVTRQMEENNEALGLRLLDRLHNGSKYAHCYDAVLIDEAQDFAPEWFECVRSAMKEPDDGDLIIVGDGSQGLYKQRSWSWKDVGINAQGRTIHSKFDLSRNYRNTREIIELAALFATTDDGEADAQERIAAPHVDPASCLRISGIKPRLVKSANKLTECIRAAEIVRDLIMGKWFGKSIEPVRPEQIGILYPRLRKNEHDLIRDFQSSLADHGCIWLSDSQDRSSRQKVLDPGIKIQTIHSAKGLQYKAVILLFANELPMTYGDVDVASERRLLYVGLTRAEDWLVVSSSGNSDFVAQLARSGLTD